MTTHERKRLSNAIFSGGVLLCLLGLVVGRWAFMLGFGAMVTSLFVGPSLVESIETYQRSKDLDRRLEADTRAAALRDELDDENRCDDD